MQRANAKGHGLPAARFGLGQHIAALQNYRQTFRLDRCHLRKAEGGQILHHGGGEGQG